MRILYRNPNNQSLSVTNVTNTQYEESDRLLIFFGDDDICLSVSQEQADTLTRILYEEGKLDLTSYICIPYEWPDDDDEDDEDDDDYPSIDGSDFVIQF